MLLLSDEVIQRELTMAKVIELVEEAFAADARGRAITFPAIVDYVGKAHAHFGLKSGHLDLDGNREVLGLKAGGYWLRNQELHGLPNHRATMLLINPDTGKPWPSCPRTPLRACAPRRQEPLPPDILRGKTQRPSPWWERASRPMHNSKPCGSHARSRRFTSGEGIRRQSRATFRPGRAAISMLELQELGRRTRGS